MKPLYLNPARRDLLKQLAAIGVTGMLPYGTVRAADGRDYVGSLNSPNTHRSDARYEELRRTMSWQISTPSRYPDLIVQAGSEQEIVEALRFAARNDLQVVARSSGHNESGAVLRNGGMLLDISSMTKLSVDAETMTASAQPGVRMAQMYPSTSQHGLIFPIADCHTVALGGYLLGGGLNPTGEYWGHGPACYSIISADIILASGEKVTASRAQNADLFWAIGGIGPGFFGVITRFELQLYHKPDVILKYDYVFPTDALPSITFLLDTLQENKDERITTSIALMDHPESPDLPAANLTIKIFTDADSPSEAVARSLIAPYVQNELLKDAISKREDQRVEFSDLMYTPDRTETTTSDNIWTNDAGALAALVEHRQNIPHGSHLFVALHHARQTRPFRDDACYSSAGAHFLSAHLSWRDALADADNYRWYAEFNDILRPYGTSHYVNQVDNARHPERIRDSFSPESWLRLAQVRKKYDPDDRFFTHLGYA
jgi:FAD/FMN-containing dehydrogenase